MKKWSCIISCAINYLLAALFFVWVALYKEIPYQKMFLITDGTFMVLCVLFAIAYLDLNLDKLFLKFEAGITEKRDKIILFTGTILALLTIAFEMVVIGIFFFRGIKMELFQLVRFFLLPNLALAHIALGSGAYLGADYFA